MRYSDNERGYTMLETIMYIGILIVLGGVLAGYAQTAISRYKTGRVVQQVTDLKKAIIHFTAADEDYANVSVANMLEHHSLPLDMRSASNTKAKHSLGGAIEIGPVAKAPLNAVDNNKNYMFFIRFLSIPQKSCIEILSQGQFYGEGSELDTLIVNQTNAWQFEFSFYDAGRFGNNGLNPARFPARCLTNNESGDCTQFESTRLTIGEATAVCTKKNDNEIIWVFS